jgi:hypothetical protein
VSVAQDFDRKITLRNGDGRAKRPDGSEFVCSAANG